MRLDIWFFAIMLSFKSFAADTEKECIALIGNPGVGKSTLVNSIVSKKVFDSGLRATGVTKICQTHTEGHWIYVDTPGLADTALRKQAAQEIENALKMNKKYRIFFVLTLEAGRIKPEDLHTIKRVMDAINNPEKSFNIIINKVTKREKQQILDNPAQFKTLCDDINNGQHKTDSFCYIESDRKLEDEGGFYFLMEERVKDFIHLKSKGFFLGNYQVGSITPETVEELRIRAQQEEERLRQQLAYQQQQREAAQREARRIEAETARLRREEEERERRRRGTCPACGSCNV